MPVRQLAGGDPPESAVYVHELARLRAHVQKCADVIEPLRFADESYDEPFFAFFWARFSFTDFWGFFFEDLFAPLSFAFITPFLSAGSNCEGTTHPRQVSRGAARSPN